MVSIKAFVTIIWDIICFGCAPSNRINGIAAGKAKNAISTLKNGMNDTLSLLGCTSESDLLYMMEQ